MFKAKVKRLKEKKSIYLYIDIDDIDNLGRLESSPLVKVSWRLKKKKE